MRTTKILMIVLLAATLFWSEPSAAELEETSADGWHNWHVDTAEGNQVQFYVLIENGKPAKIRSLNGNCRKPTRDKVDDHGTVSAAESYAWFRAVVEDAAVDEHVRDAALFGLVESGSDDAFEYIDQILSQR